jgi:Zn-dependent hydrolases, including glyoxylases
VKIVQLTYKSANCYLIPSNEGWVMIDTGWPDTFSQLLQLLYQNNISVNEVDYLIITHYHPGHAGLTQNLKDLGTNLILHEAQVPYYNKLNSFFKKNPKANFKDITNYNNVILSNSDSKKFFESIGINGELLYTPGHSDDSISMVLQDECAFIGDLPTIFMHEDFNTVIADSWHLIQQRNVKTIYPGHGTPIELNLQTNP